MSRTFFIGLERWGQRGWSRVDWPDIPKPPRSKYAFDPHCFFDRDFFYVLSSVEYRIDFNDYPEPLVAQPRGMPLDLGPEWIDVEKGDGSILHWLWPSEVLLYDWHAYERFGSSPCLPHEFLDVIAALDPIDGYRLILGME